MALGALRGAQVRVWRDDRGVLMRQGDAVTIGIWVVAIAIHLGLDVVIGKVDPAADGLGTAGILAYLALVLAAQQVVTLRRSQKPAVSADHQPRRA